MNPLVIKLVLPASAHRPLVDQFIANQYQRMKVQPSLPPIMFAAFEEGAVTATAGLEFCEKEDDLIPCERAFSFDWQLLPFPAHRTNSVLYTRWAATNRSVSGTILLAATRYALELGKAYGLCELKPPVAKRLEQLGVGLHEITGAAIKFEAISGAVRNYYESAPQPRLYQMDLHQMERDLR